jgi:beta-lactamase regulating signal transducer with metallopeptidase domain
MDKWMYVAGWTLVHFVWQGAVIAAGAAIGFSLLRSATSNVRYMFASAALLLMPVSLVVTACLISPPAATPTGAQPAAASSISLTAAPFAVRFDSSNPGTRAPHSGAGNALRRLPQAFPVIVMSWLTGVAILLVRLLSGWWRVRALQRAAFAAPPSRWQAAASRLARRLGIRRRVSVADAETVETPTVIGWWRPVIVLPLAALSGLTPTQADAILLHELAHIRRHDYLVNLLQHVTETVLFYHPAVWWLSHRMRVEREQCCDAIVVDLCADALDYATALTRLEEARQPHTRLAVAATGGSLVERVRRLLGARTDRHTPVAHAIVTAAVTALVVLVVVGGGYQWSSRLLLANGRSDQRVEPAPGSAQASTILHSRWIRRQDADQIQKLVPATDGVTVTAEAAEEVAQARTDTVRSDMSIAVEVNYFQLNRAEYAVPVSVRIPGTEITLARQRGATRTTIEFSGDVNDELNVTVQNISDRVDFALSDDAVAQMATRPIQYETMVTLLPGKYTIRLQAREVETGRVGSFQTSFVIPNLNRAPQIPISTVVLGSQVVRFDGDRQTNRPNPLVRDGLKMIPSVTRVFSKTQQMYVFLQAYEPEATTAQPLVAFVRLYRGDVKVLETAPLRVSGALEGRAKAVPLFFTVPLGDLATGRYDCEVTVGDPDGQKVTAWRAPVDLVP